MPWELERVLFCEAINWKYLPHELDNLNTADLKIPIQTLRFFRTLQRAGEDLDSLTEPDSDRLAYIYAVQKEDKRLTEEKSNKGYLWRLLKKLRR